MPELFEVMTTQRAHRQYLADPVPPEMIDKLIAAATHAPSAENRQPWVFIVVSEPERRRAIGKMMQSAWAGGAKQFSEGRLPKSLLDEVDRGAKGGIAAAPILIVVCGDGEIGLAPTLSSSIYLATQNLLLAAAGMGLGSAMTTLAALDPEPLQELLDLPSHVSPMAVVPIGWPARKLGPPRRRPVTEVAHRERYGGGWHEA